MDYPTLLLNIGYEPIRLINWRDAITKWVLGKVEIIESYKDRPLRSKDIVMQTPAVVRINRGYHKYCTAVSFDRYHVYARDGWTCQYCGQRFSESHLTYDHVIPKCRGGKRDWLNIVTACEACNNKKADRTPKEARMPLLKRPTRPRWMPNLLVDAIRKSRKVPEQWALYIAWIESAAPNASPVL